MSITRAIFYSIFFCYWSKRVHGLCSPLLQLPRTEGLPAERTSHGSRSDTCPRRSWYTPRYGRNEHPHTGCTPNATPQKARYCFRRQFYQRFCTAFRMHHYYKHHNGQRVWTDYADVKQSQPLSSEWWYCAGSIRILRTLILKHPYPFFFLLHKPITDKLDTRTVKSLFDFVSTWRNARSQFLKKS